MRLLPLTLITLLSCAERRSEGTDAGDCTDAADNDGDGLFDCDDEGCAASPDCTNTTESDADTDSDTDSDTDADGWAGMDSEERFTYMTDVVNPTMKELFVAFGETQFQDFDCESCHGGDMVEVDYVMPHVLYPLSLDDFPYTENENEAIVRFAVFMDEDVLPVMAELLGEKAQFDETSTEGFGCFGCHAQTD